ncbi:MAG: lipB [Ferruginibacter sp.]|nr:lipB [Ferruginibacter sp.]
MQEVKYEDLGMIPYRQAWEMQEALLSENLAAKTSARQAAVALPADATATQHHFLVCEHPHVYTLGKNGSLSNLLLTPDQLEERGIAFFNSNRGGDITYHGPQQLVGYPVLDLEKIYTDIGKYLRNLEEVIIRVIAEFGINGGRSEGETGVWLDPTIPGKERKICAIGVRCSRWVTMHGFALNVNTDLSYFDHIIPCGIQNKQVTSIERETGQRADMQLVKHTVKKHFEEVFEVRWR